jgi:enterochelin esterase-like enzyme
MRRPAARIAIGLIALAVTSVGMLGALSYGRDYNLNRGFGTLVQFRRAGTGRLVKVQFHSRALRRTADYLVYLPPHYSPARRYPVYYLLHGMPGQPRVFVDIANMDVRLDNQLSLGHARPMILVYPDGRVGTSVFSDSEWANTRAGNFESYVLDVMHNVDRHFATLPDRRDRVIAGFSAGAYGAMNIALHHLADFGAVEAWSGYFTQTRTGVFAHAGRAALAYNSPLDIVTHPTRRLAHQLAIYPLRTYLFAGRADGASHQVLPMADALRARGVRVQYGFFPGGHDWSVWYPRLNQMLNLASWDVGHPPRHIAGRQRHGARHLSARRRRAARRLSGRHRHAARSLSARPHAARGLRKPVVQASAAPRLGSGAAVFGHHPPHRQRELRLIGVLLLALASAALINLGFVLQHRGRAQDLAAGHASLRHALRNRSWLSGQALGWIGFAGQIVAVALAPLTLVQAFAAGSLAISVPLAARILGQRVGRAQLIAVAVVAVSLASLPVGLGRHHGHLQPGALLMAALVTLLAAIALALRGRTIWQAVASGALYGVADAAIKADALGLHAHGPGALMSGWTILAALCTFGGFLAFQGALRGADAVQPLSLMNAFTAVTAVGLGVGGFGESLGASAPAIGGHLIAIALVLGCVRPLTQAQESLIHADEPDLPTSHDAAPGGTRARPPLPAGARRSPGLPRIVRRIATGAGSSVAVLICAVSGVGLLYSLRQLHWLGMGPSVPDALPLLQLAGFSGQPLARMIGAWIPAGVVLGLVLIRFPAMRRALFILMLGAALLLFASDASYALTRNLRFGDVLLRRPPGLGPWVECLMLAAGSALTRTWTRSRHRAAAPGRISGPSAISVRSA